MIYHQPGEEFWHEGVCYKVGGRIVANEASDYAGLFGNILEIRTEDDRETDNDTPDIYCAFDPPVLSAGRLALEQTFSQLYHEQKHIEDLGLDILILITDEILGDGVHEGIHDRISCFSGHDQGLALISHCMRTAVGFLLFFRIDELNAHGMNIVHSVAPFDPFRA